MGRQSFFLVVPSVDSYVVLRTWTDFCAAEKARLRRDAIRQLEEESAAVGERLDRNAPEFEDAIEEILWYSGSPDSFDGCRFEYVPRPEGIQSVSAFRSWMLSVHEKWDPALAVECEGETILGGWVAI